MKTRLPIALLLLLTACGDSAGEQPVAEAAAGDERIACAVDGAASLERVCSVERLSGPEGTTLTLRHPGGGFRRLLVATDGRGVVAADGADPARVSVISGDGIEVAIAGDRYRLPATVKGAR